MSFRQARPRCLGRFKQHAAGASRAAWSTLGFTVIGGGLVLACTFELHEPLDPPAGAGASAGASSGGAGAATGGTSTGGNLGPCTPGASQDFGECELCGRSIRVCESNGQWGEPTCEQQGVCSPGEPQTEPCGNCGTTTSICSDSCTWGDWGSCTGEGVCAADSTQQGSCDPCAQQTCSTACAWSGCELTPGNECEYQSGSNWQYCGPPDHWQFCSSACSWHPCQPI